MHLPLLYLLPSNHFLSCVVADGMINGKHRSDTELVAQGLGNIASALFGGIPATGAIARTAANIKNGGRTPVAGMVHSITLVIVLVVLMPFAGMIPMPTIAAILFVVAYNMCQWRTFVHMLKTAPKKRYHRVDRHIHFNGCLRSCRCDRNRYGHCMSAVYQTHE